MVVCPLDGYALVDFVGGRGDLLPFDIQSSGRNGRMQHETHTELRDAGEILQTLGITANYVGYFYMLYAVRLTMQAPERLLLVTKWLYPEVARYYKTTWQCVERDLRSVVALSWQRSRPQLEQLLRRPLPQRPTVSEFLAALTMHLSPPRAA